MGALMVFAALKRTLGTGSVVIRTISTDELGHGNVNWEESGGAGQLNKTYAANVK